MGNGSFSAKRAVFKNASLKLTAEVGAFETWGPAQIDDRQVRLADLAVKA
ncbi:MAG: HNH endonuclease [Pyrinomonadaceae bacterium]|nr:HNH endonuclease [Pyrinomonadaceae bacterium]